MDYRQFLPLGFIGGGVMAEAIFARLISAGIYRSDEIYVSEPFPERQAYLSSNYGITLCDSNDALVGQAKTLILAIKPQVFPQVLKQLQGQYKETPLLVLSIMAGTPIAAIESAFPDLPVIRVMPNTPATVGAGISALALGNHATDVHLDVAESIFKPVGEVVTVPESSMDAVTALSGSGPAYVAIAVEALSDAGVSVGLPRAIATQLALQTVRGTSELMHLSQLHPAIMKDKVASPGGTTIAGIAALEKAGFRNALIEAVQAAHQRSVDLANASTQA